MSHELHFSSAIAYCTLNLSGIKGRGFTVTTKVMSGGAGVGEEQPSRLREEKVGISGLPTDITLRLNINLSENP